MHIVNLHDSTTGNSAKVLAGLGFNCYSWQVCFAEGSRELLWAEPGFETGEQRPSGSGIPLLFPFPGRIGHAEYTYGDRTYRLPHDASRPHALHGFLFDRPWRVVDQTDTKVTAAFQASVDDLAILKQWPSDFSVTATYELVGSELQFTAKFTNTGDGDLPWGFGTHAYFRLPLADGADVADAVITAPVDAEWQLDDMLPTGQRVNLPADLTLTDGLRLGDWQFDSVYQLAANDGEVTTTVSDPASGRCVRQCYDGSDFPQLVIYTPGHREAVCVEPYSCVPDPFRLTEQGVAAGLRTLNPGQSFDTSFVLIAES